MDDDGNWIKNLFRWEVIVSVYWITMTRTFKAFSVFEPILNRNIFAYQGLKVILWKYSTWYFSLNMKNKIFRVAKNVQTYMQGYAEIIQYVISHRNYFCWVLMIMPERSEVFFLSQIRQKSLSNARSLHPKGLKYSDNCRVGYMCALYNLILKDMDVWDIKVCAVCKFYNISL